MDAVVDCGVHRVSNTSWTDENFTSRNVLTNYVEKTGIADFSRWTLTTPGNALPVKFILFNVKCIDDKVMLHWKTAFEQNSSYYEIQRSADGVSWMVIGSVPAAGYSSVEKSYTFTDINPLSSRAFYRIAEFDISGSIQYTGIVTNNCSQDERIQYWLNPVTHQLYVTINSAIKSTVTISVFDTKGALAGKQQNNLLEGNNQLVVNMNHLANGTYFVSITRNKGQNLKTIKVIKQQ
ncbi:MAG: T9SS type A sorting domain-containing protein [Chitinophagaceae bacterium]|nr:T9SS type A sorting domain-containing protein [Chitinophagaceae bacterium]